MDDLSSAHVDAAIRTGQLSAATRTAAAVHAIGDGTYLPSIGTRQPRAGS